MTEIVFAIIFIGLLFYVLFSIVWWTIKNGISPSPTSQPVKRALLNRIPKQQEGKIYELGSGWGTLLLPIAKQHPQCTVIGYESSPIPYYASLILRWISGLKNVILLKKDFFKEPLSDSSLIVCYLYPGAMERLKTKFEEELRPGTLVISHTFAIPGWTPADVIQVNDLYQTKIYLYQR